MADLLAKTINNKTTNLTQQLTNVKADINVLKRRTEFCNNLNMNSYYTKTEIDSQVNEIKKNDLNYRVFNYYCNGVDDNIKLLDFINDSEHQIQVSIGYYCTVINIIGNFGIDLSYVISSDNMMSHVLLHGSSNIYDFSKCTGVKYCNADTPNIHLYSNSNINDSNSTIQNSFVPCVIISDSTIRNVNGGIPLSNSFIIRTIPDNFQYQDNWKNIDSTHSTVISNCNKLNSYDIVGICAINSKLINCNFEVKLPKYNNQSICNIKACGIFLFNSIANELNLLCNGSKKQITGVVTANYSKLCNSEIYVYNDGYFSTSEMIEDGATYDSDNNIKSKYKLITIGTEIDMTSHCFGCSIYASDSDFMGYSVNGNIIGDMSQCCAGYGGGVYDNCTFIGNGNFNGYGFYISSGSMFISSNCTFYGFTLIGQPWFTGGDAYGISGDNDNDIKVMISSAICDYSTPYNENNIIQPEIELFKSYHTYPGESSNIVLETEKFQSQTTPVHLNGGSGYYTGYFYKNPIIPSTIISHGHFVKNSSNN